MHENRLAHETSPYLLQHAHNPVDWYPWGEEALRAAREQDKPIFLSIGYSACHWCHVMEHECFEDPRIAKLMNEKFINIKVDREERPDLDDIYMAAVVGMTGRGGWPMSVFLTPDLEPFFGGTYWPPHDSHGMPGFVRILEHVDRVWHERRDDVDRAAADMGRYLREQLQPEPEPGDPEASWIAQAVQESANHYDPEHGGFAPGPYFAPKFPHAAELTLLLRHAVDRGDQQALAMVSETLHAMAAGGIYDQLGFGFHRYSTDREWLVPHFEKMLYDNAQLARLYCEAFAATGEELYRRIARETFHYVLREMQDPAGGFYSTQDADSEGVEGKFFVWDRDELVSALGDDAAVAEACWGVTAAGNWEHGNVLHVAQSPATVAEATGRSEEEVVAALARAREKLLAIRDQRVHPATDDKVLAAWNGLMIDALAYGYQTLGDRDLLKAARRGADFVLGQMRRDDGRLLRTWRHGEAKLPAYLEDYAFVTNALLTLFECDGDPRWLESAKALLTTMQQHFLDGEHGGFFFTADDHENLVARSKTVQESSMPSGQAIAAQAFLRASLLLGDPALEEIARGTVRVNASMLQQHPTAAPGLLLVAQMLLADPREVVVAKGAGDDDGETAGAFLQRAWRSFPPYRVVIALDDDNRAALLALAPDVCRDKDPIDGKTAAYVCRHGTCERPAVEPAALELR